MRNITIVRDSGKQEKFVPVTIPPPPTGKIYGRVKHDAEMFPGMGRPDLNKVNFPGLPEVHKLDTHKSVPEEWQWLWFRIFRRRLPPDFSLSMVVDKLSDDDRRFLSEQKSARTKLRLMAATMSEDEAIQLFGVITRKNAFKTNQHACENGYANYVTGCNTNAAPMKTEVIVTGGTYLELLDGDKTVNHSGIPCYRVPMLNMTKPISEAEKLLADWDGIHQTPYIYFATTSKQGGVSYPLLGGDDIAIINVSDADYSYMPTIVDTDFGRGKLMEVLPANAPPPNPYYMWP